jgi:hypothetical protein
MNLGSTIEHVMDVSDLRQRILRALDAARTDAATRRSETDAARAAFDQFLENVAVPLLKQAQAILKAENHMFTVHAPAGGAKLVSDAHAETYLEFTLDTAGKKPQVVGRLSSARGARRVAVEEKPVAPGKAVQDLGDDDVAAFLVGEIPRLVSRN